ncbi:hypothetical protein CYMTET_52599 [Cymbomonas tetramitiformis]|uniref:Nucleotide-diphospho-sugar transferase domain-containing protein n=1 Tax=Cymbomonas tetramitiformis TaxID=36881 RepID=A0AAE0BIY7_9CHLO|nr:hypothetical protein CYMTET_52599 [Cymbomonas tetramitiformis]
MYEINTFFIRFLGYHPSGRTSCNFQTIRVVLFFCFFCFSWISATSVVVKPALFANRLQYRSDDPEWESLPAKGPYESGGDIEEPGEIRRAIDALSYKGEILFTIATEHATGWVGNLVFGLRQVHVHNVLVITMNKGHCDLLKQAPWNINCVWTSYQSPGNDQAHTGSYRMEWSKYHYMYHFVAAGVNPLFLDSDITVQENPYPYLRGPALRGLHAVLGSAHDRGIGAGGPAFCSKTNAGFLYCNDCKINGPAHLVFGELMRRHAYFQSFGDNPEGFWEELDAMGATAGPHIMNGYRGNLLLNDVVGSWCCGKELMPRVQASTFQMKDPTKFHAVLGTESPECGRLLHDDERDIFYKPLKLLPVWAQNSSITIPPNEDKVAFAPAWLFANYNGMGNLKASGGTGIPGYWGGYFHTPPVIAHFMGTEAPKADVMKGLGWWNWTADVLEAFITKESAKENVAHKGRFNSLHTHTYRVSQVNLKLQSLRRMVLASGPGMETALRSAAEHFAFKDTYVQWRTTLHIIARLTDRQLVDATVPCDSEWIPRNPQAMLGVEHRPLSSNKSVILAHTHLFPGAILGDAAAPSRMPPLVSHPCEKEKDAFFYCTEALHPMFLEDFLELQLSQGRTFEDVAQVVRIGRAGMSRSHIQQARTAKQEVLWLYFEEGAKVDAAQMTRALSSRTRHVLDDIVEQGNAYCTVTKDECRELLDATLKNSKNARQTHI